MERISDNQNGIFPTGRPRRNQQNNGISLPPVTHSIDLDSGIQAKSQIYGLASLKQNKDVTLPSISLSPQNRSINKIIELREKEMEELRKKSPRA